MSRRWLITGCSTGLGRALAERALADGDRVVATARKPEVLDDLRQRFGDSVAVAPLDICDPSQVNAAVGVAQTRFGGLDMLVNNAAYGQFGAVEEVSDAELEAQFRTNVFGTWRMTRAVLPLMRAQRFGHVLLLSSTAGRLVYPGLGAYCASKFAVEGMGEALAAELSMFGVKVTLIEPGMFATHYGRSVVEAATTVEDYQPLLSQILTPTRGIAELPMASQPSDFADVVMRLVELPDPPLRLPVGRDAWESISTAVARHQTELDTAADALGATVH